MNELIFLDNLKKKKLVRKILKIEPKKKKIHQDCHPKSEGFNHVKMNELIGSLMM